MEAILSGFHSGSSESRFSSSEIITVPEFLQETWDDYNSPTTSNFVQHIGRYRSTTGMLEETLDFDRSGLTKMKKAVKALSSSGNMQISHEALLADNLELLGRQHADGDSSIGDAFIKFAIVTREMSVFMKTLMQNLSNIVVYPLDTFVKNELRGTKGDLKKPFDKAAKEYETKFSKIEKEKKQAAKEAGLIKDLVSGAEVAEVLEKERRNFQLQMCEYLIKVNEIRTKKGVDLLQRFVDYYWAQHNYFQDGLKTIEHFREYIEDLVKQLNVLKTKQDAERRQLLELRGTLHTFMSSYKEPTPAVPPVPVYNLHQLQGNKVHGYEKSGYLLKKSEGRVRKAWQRRRCVVSEGMLSIGHSDVSKEPVMLNLLTCQVKLVQDDMTKKCFDLISSSKNRTYHFQGEDTQDMEAWISVLNNAKELVLMKAFGDAGSSDSNPYNQNLKELTRTILQQVRRLPGNNKCCDCGAPDPEWLSVNLGVLICLECCGVHRDMGVHISRTQSIVIDDLSTAQLLMARAISNSNFNDIMEAALPEGCKPTPSSNMDEKKIFIRSKYEKRRYAIVTCAAIEDRRQDLKMAISARDILALLQVYAEGIDFMEPLPDMQNEETALHLAISEEDGTSLFMVDFIIQNTNSRDLCRKSKDGNTALHLCAELNKPECMKLLLRSLPELVNYENANRLTALEIAKSKNHEVCITLLNHAIGGMKEMFEQVNFDWAFVLQDEQQQDFVDYSDDENLDGNSVSQTRTKPRPGSLIFPDTPGDPHHQKRAHTTDSLKNLSLPPPNEQISTSVPSVNNKPTKSATHHTSLRGGFTQPVAPPPDPPSSSLKAHKKPPAPPPPGSRPHHLRNPSDPGLCGFRGSLQSPSDPPPPLPSKAGLANVPGAKPVVPPMVPPKKKSIDDGGKTTNLSKALSSSTSASLDSQSNNATTPPYNTKSTVLRPQLSSASSTTSTKQCVALYDCQADNDDELSFRSGEVINILKQDEDEWWEGEVVSDPTRKGLFPTTFVQLL